MLDITARRDRLGRATTDGVHRVTNDVSGFRPRAACAPGSETPEMLRDRIVSALCNQLGKSPATATARDWFVATVSAVRAAAIGCDLPRMGAPGGKQVCYLSIEFLIGRLLMDAIGNLGMMDTVRAALQVVRRRSRRRCRGGAGRRARQWRPGPAGRLLDGEHGERRRARLSATASATSTAASCRKSTKACSANCPRIGCVSAIPGNMRATKSPGRSASAAR